LYENVCYSKPVLKEAIVRIDFSGPVEALDKGVPSRVAKAILKHFPISEPRELVANELQFGQGAAPLLKQSQFIESNYYGKDREKRFAISRGAMFVTYQRYTTYESLKSEFMSIATALFDTVPDVTASRLGMRFINHITQGPDGPFSWGEVINDDLLGLVSRFNDPNHVNRVFHIVEFRHDDLGVKFQFGLPNPDFPAQIRRRLFVLDIDAYVQGALEPAHVSGTLDQAHTRIQQLFEESITDALRVSMGATVAE
jgi:uncharacterized protein (TIGR04255 family)